MVNLKPNCANLRFIKISKLPIEKGWGKRGKVLKAGMLPPACYAGEVFVRGLQFYHYTFGVYGL